MRFEGFFTETGTFTHQVSPHQASNGGVDMYNGAAREVQRAILSEETARPHHMCNWQVGKGQPDNHEDQHRREANTFSNGTDDQTHGDTGEGGLERNVDILIERAHHKSVIGFISDRGSGCHGQRR